MKLGKKLLVGGSVCALAAVGFLYGPSGKVDALCKNKQNCDVFAQNCILHCGENNWLCGFKIVGTSGREFTVEVPEGFDTVN